MNDIKNIKEILAKVTKGETWINFDGNVDTKIVYEYNRLTEETSDIIAECESFEVAAFLADVPEIISSLITTIEQKDQFNVELCKQILAHETTIESQKEEIAKKDAALMAWMEREEKLKKAFDQLESKQLTDQKDITELAVKGLKRISQIKVPDNVKFVEVELYTDLGKIAASTLFKIEKLKNV